MTFSAPLMERKFSSINEERALAWTEYCTGTYTWYSYGSKDCAPTPMFEVKHQSLAQCNALCKCASGCKFFSLGDWILGSGTICRGYTACATMPSKGIWVSRTQYKKTTATRYTAPAPAPAPAPASAPASAEDDFEDNDDYDGTTAAIIGGTVGGFFFLVCVFFCGFSINRRLLRDRKKKQIGINDDSSESPVSSGSQRGATSPSKEGARTEPTATDSQVLELVDLEGAPMKLGGTQKGVALGLDEASGVGPDLDSVAAAGMGAAAATAASAPKVVEGAHKVVNVVSSAVNLASANISKVN